MRDNIKHDMATLYDKINKEATEGLKTYNGGIKALEHQTKRIWAITGGKEALFWSVCIGVGVMC